MRVFETLFDISPSSSKRFWFFVSESQLVGFSNPIACLVHKPLVGYALQLLKRGQTKILASLFAGHHSWVAATSIFIKNNLVGMYPDQGKVIKASIPHGARAADAFYNEFDILKVLEAKQFSFAPKALGVTHDHEGAVCTEFVSGVGLRPGGAVSAQALVTPLFEMYESFGVQAQRVKDHPLLAEILHTQGLCLVQDYGWEPELADSFFAALSGFAEQTVLVSQIHGDAQFGNMLWHNGRLMIIDWEMSRQAWVGIDMCTLSKDCSAVAKLYADWRTQYNTNTLLALEVEFLLVSVLSSVNINKSKEYFMSRYKDKRKSLRKIQSTLEAIKSAVGQLSQAHREQADVA
jgi:hypothetical protein